DSGGIPSVLITSIPAAFSDASLSSVLLPMPASPVRHKPPPRPARARSRRSRTAASSRDRPSSMRPGYGATDRRVGRGPCAADRPTDAGEQSGRLDFGEVRVDGGNHHGPLADRRGHPLDGSGAHITDGEHSGYRRREA